MMKIQIGNYGIGILEPAKGGKDVVVGVFKETKDGRQKGYGIYTGD